MRRLPLIAPLLACPTPVLAQTHSAYVTFGAGRTHDPRKAAISPLG
jgi:hypothetical protein